MLVQRPTASTASSAQRQRVDAAVVGDVAGVDGVTAAAGSIQAFTQLVKADGTVGAENGLGVTIGANWIADDRLNPFHLASGRHPHRVAPTPRSTPVPRLAGRQLGDTFSALTSIGAPPATLVGTAERCAIDGCRAVADRDD